MGHYELFLLVRLIFLLYFIIIFFLVKRASCRSRQLEVPMFPGTPLPTAKPPDAVDRSSAPTTTFTTTSDYEMCKLAWTLISLCRWDLGVTCYCSIAKPTLTYACPRRPSTIIVNPASPTSHFVHFSLVSYIPSPPALFSFWNTAAFSYLRLLPMVFLCWGHFFWSPLPAFIFNSQITQQFLREAVPCSPF